MTIAEIVEIETARQESSTWNVIHLLKEGDFYRAHDWSAWLMSAYPFGEAVEKPLKVIRSVNSYLGIFRHTSSFKLSRKLLMKKEIMKTGIFSQDMTKCIDRILFYKSLNFLQL